jgi:hypothetical protein
MFQKIYWLNYLNYSMNQVCVVISARKLQLPFMPLHKTEDCLIPPELAHNLPSVSGSTCTCELPPSQTYTLTLCELEFKKWDQMFRPKFYISKIMCAIVIEMIGCALVELNASALISYCMSLWPA